MDGRGRPKGEGMCGDIKEFFEIGGSEVMDRLHLYNPEDKKITAQNRKYVYGNETQQQYLAAKSCIKQKSGDKTVVVRCYIIPINKVSWSQFFMSKDIKIVNFS